MRYLVAGSGRQVIAGELQAGIALDGRLEAQNNYIRSRHGGSEGKLIPSVALILRIRYVPCARTRLAAHRRDGSLCIRVQQYADSQFTSRHFRHGQLGGCFA